MIILKLLLLFILNSPLKEKNISYQNDIASAKSYYFSMKDFDPDFDLIAFTFVPFELKSVLKSSLKVKISFYNLIHFNYPRCRSPPNIIKILC